MAGPGKVISLTHNETAQQVETRPPASGAHHGGCKITLQCISSMGADCPGYGLQIEYVGQIPCKLDHQKVHGSSKG